MKTRGVKALRWWPVLTFVWSLLGLGIFFQVVTQTEMGVSKSVLYTLVMIGISVIVIHLLSDLMLPYFMKRKQMLRFIVLALFTCMFLALLYTYSDRLFNFDDRPFVAKWLNMLLSALLLSGNICGLRFYREHIIIERDHRQLQTAHLEAELKLLRDQINPHFLFNVINSIHVLLRKDVKQASSVLLKFSDMLRHQLYDAGKEQVLLSEEVAYLKNYVNVEMVRWGEDVTVHCEWPDPTEEILLAPFLLSPFVENAFKFVSRDTSDGNFVRLRLSIRGTELVMEIENTFDAELPPTGVERAGGIGLENVKKRLSLLYPDRHQLKIWREDELFRVQLIIQSGAA